MSYKHFFLLTSRSLLSANEQEMYSEETFTDTTGINSFTDRGLSYEAEQIKNVVATRISLN